MCWCREHANVNNVLYPPSEPMICRLRESFQQRSSDWQNLVNHVQLAQKKILNVYWTAQKLNRKCAFENGLRSWIRLEYHYTDLWEQIIGHYADSIHLVHEIISVDYGQRLNLSRRYQERTNENLFNHLMKIMLVNMLFSIINWNTFPFYDIHNYLKMN